MGFVYSRSATVSSGKSGFTLIELAIVMVIFGIFFSVIVRSLETYQTRERQKTSVERTAEASEQLAEFASRFDGPDANTSPDNRLPCPSNPTIGLGQAGFGAEQCPPPTAVAGDVFNGVQVAVNPLGEKIYIGGFPTATMTEEGRSAFDGHNAPLVYAVTASLTAAGTVTSSNPLGGIHVNVDGGGVRTNAPLIVASTGRNGWQSTGTGPTGDAENIDGDHVFSAFSGHSTVEAASYYDDELVFRLGDVASCTPNKIDVQRFTADGTWTKPPGFVYADVTVNGAGGGSATCYGIGWCSGSTCDAALGGGGGVARRIFGDGDIPSSVAVTIGKGGETACPTATVAGGPDCDTSGAFASVVKGYSPGAKAFEGKDASATSFGTFIVVSGGKGATLSGNTSFPLTAEGVHGTQTGADDYVENASTEPRQGFLQKSTSTSCSDGAAWTDNYFFDGKGNDGSVAVTSFVCR